MCTRRQPAERPRTDLTASLLARLRSADTTAGNLLDQIYRRPLIRLCYGYLRNQQAAEDAVQEVFCRVLRAGEVPDNFRAWVYRIARNYCLGVLRAQQGGARTPRGLPPSSCLPGSATGQLSRLVKQEQRARMAQVVGALPEEQREVLNLRYGDGLSRAEIAYVLDISEATVKSRLFQAVKKLREHASLVNEA